MGRFLVRKSNSQQLLLQLISDDKFISEVQALEPTIVRQIIKHVGLEDASELLPLLTSEQLQEVMDQDIWLKTSPGNEDEFDLNRFTLWIAMLLESGADFAAEKVFEMDEELLILALSKLIMVLDKDELEALMAADSDEDEYSFKQLDKVLESTFNIDIDNYVLMSKESSQWETTIDIILALQKNHSDLIERALLRISQITLELIEEADGLVHLLKESEMFDNDVSSSRQERREQEGYVGPSAAKAFLKLIEQTSTEDILKETEQDHLTKMYFRGLKPSKVKSRTPLSTEMLLLLESHGIKIQKKTQTKKLTSQRETSQVQQYLQELQHRDAESFKVKLIELNYLANVLISGFIPTDKSKKFLRPVEAMELAIKICDLGFKHSPDLIKAFKLGWKTLK